jgi:muramoyltetrapeptide carboxypeptidase
VALISPAYWIPEEAILQAAEVIRSWGLQPVIGPHTTSLNVDAYAGTAEERAADLLWALEDDSIKAIFCSRGGYGSIHLLDRIPLEDYRKHPKWLMGHGDITTLLYTAAGAGVMSIHGPMAFQIAGGQEPATTIARNILFGTLPQYKIAGNAYNRSGHAEGILVGGNLSSYVTITGTKYHHLPSQDIILFVEEVEESLHAIDRLFYTLRLQLDFERVKGIIFGTFSSIKFDLQFGSVEQMLIAHLHDLDIPVCCGFPVGSNSCLPLIEGVPCSLDVTPEKAVLTFEIKGSTQPYDIEKDSPKLIKADDQKKD